VTELNAGVELAFIAGALQGIPPPPDASATAKLAYGLVVKLQESYEREVACRGALKALVAEAEIFSEPRRDRIVAVAKAALATGTPTPDRESGPTVEDTVEAILRETGMLRTQARTVQALLVGLHSAMATLGHDNFDKLAGEGMAQSLEQVMANNEFLLGCMTARDALVTWKQQGRLADFLDRFYPPEQPDGESQQMVARLEAAVLRIIAASTRLSMAQNMEEMAAAQAILSTATHVAEIELRSQGTDEHAQFARVFVQTQAKEIGALRIVLGQVSAALKAITPGSPQLQALKRQAVALVDEALESESSATHPLIEMLAKERQ
jgi:hypothetical protein